MTYAAPIIVYGGNGTCFWPALRATKPFLKVSNESIDYAVMENIDRAAMVISDMGWSDIRNWQALHTASAKDELGNSVQGAHDDAELIDCRNVYISNDGQRISIVEARDLIVVADGNNILIIRPQDLQKVGSLSGAKPI